MATRPFDQIAENARKTWTPDVHDFAASYEAELRTEVREQIRLGHQLAAARTAAHLTQKQLAERAHVPQPEISRIERGLGNPTRDTLLKLTTAMGAQITIVPPATHVSA